jgi:NAD(P)-dependent dehydrogenase (short-subunit alcohol dehydrogenase family)
MKDFEGRCAVVTGAASGIGAGIARALAARGAKLVLADIEEAPIRTLAEALPAEAIAIHCDVSDPSAVEELARRAYSAYGSVHLLCNNAGVCQGGPIWEMRDEDWRWLMGVNFGGVVNGCRTFVPRLIAQQDPAHVVNTASIGGFVTGGELGMYSVSKYAVVSYTEALSQELAPHGIGASVLCPGWTNTRLGDAARNRPRHLGDAPAKLELILPGMASGMTPDEVGRHLVRGVEEEALYIFTQRDLAPVLSHRFDQVLAALDHAGDPIPGS